MSRDLLARITVEPDKMGGRPCIRRMRIRVMDIVEMLADGATRADILDRTLSLKTRTSRPRCSTPRRRQIIAADYLGSG